MLTGVIIGLGLGIVVCVVALGLMIAGHGLAQEGKG